MIYSRLSIVFAVTEGGAMKPYEPPLDPPLVNCSHYTQFLLVYTIVATMWVEQLNTVCMYDMVKRTWT